MEQNIKKKKKGKKKRLEKHRALVIFVYFPTYSLSDNKLRDIFLTKQLMFRLQLELFKKIIQRWRQYLWLKLHPKASAACYSRARESESCITDRGWWWKRRGDTLGSEKLRHVGINYRKVQPSKNPLFVRVHCTRPRELPL